MTGNQDKQPDRRNVDLLALEEHSDIFQCPVCRAKLSVTGDQRVRCALGHEFPVEKGLPLLFSPHEEYNSEQDVTDAMKSFYMENPFPDYEDFDSVGSLMERSKTSVFARALDEQVPLGTRVLEVGCGTGQLSIFLSIARRQVFGVDLCPNSLQLARKFRDQHDLRRAHFFQMNVFRPIFKDASFDLVYCSGVLHHTRFPRRGFDSICRLVKPGKYIIIGLYNSYMRIPTHIRRFISRFVDIEKIEPVMRRFSTQKKQKTWFMDQYRNPHETDHTVAEVIGWFEADGFDYVSSIPSARLGQTANAILHPFQQQEQGSKWEIALSQIVSTKTFGREGGLFLVVGKRRN